MRNNLHNWLALHRVPGIGPVKFQQCLLADRALNNLPSWVRPDWQAVERDLQLQRQEHCHILTLQDKHYPKLLLEITNPPPVLFVQGNLEVLQTQQIAIVGSRSPSPHGSEIAYNFAKHFVELGFTITSGLALGIDTSSHKGALSGGKTIAVFGCGLDQIYPATNKALASKIVESEGALLSEFPIGVAPKAGNFPSRNRIISGLSLGVLVVEAAVSSGALITAEIAAEQGRDVFAIPGSIYNAKAKGCHKLIKQGAKLVESADDILEELNSLLNKPITNKSCFKTKRTGTISSNIAIAPEYIELLSYINSYVISVDELVVKSKRSVQEVVNILMQLELAGHITAVPGGYVNLCQKI